MIVADASALVALLLSAEAGERVRKRFRGETVAVPHLADLEVLSVLRRHRSRIPSKRVVRTVAAYRDLALVRYDHVPHLQRIWQLRNNLTVYDAMYVALAEALDAPLVTLDARLAGAPGAKAHIELIR